MSDSARFFWITTNIATTMTTKVTIAKAVMLKTSAMAKSASIVDMRATYIGQWRRSQNGRPLLWRRGQSTMVSREVWSALSREPL